MAKAISIPTISHEDPANFDSAAFHSFNRFVKQCYPLVDSLLELTPINEFSMIYKWTGSDPDLRPVILMGHHDVVPVADENIIAWSAPPFSGEIKDGY
ncbi:MAG: hypothetical protein R3345_09440, partial [Fulvivirga sp.]|nr:hypothetical protein [Fulvivirga sp.]